MLEYDRPWFSPIDQGARSRFDWRAPRRARLDLDRGDGFSLGIA